MFSTGWRSRVNQSQKVLVMSTVDVVLLTSDPDVQSEDNIFSTFSVIHSLVACLKGQCQSDLNELFALDVLRVTQVNS